MITPKDILETARLAKLYVDDEEIDDLCTKMQSIVDFAGEVCSAPKVCKSRASVTDNQNVFREDRVEASLPVCDVLRNAQDTQEDYFLVKRS
ncbi:MAG: Asp-tRNA(Asn)/Glu-tRNA(Gln) amidotransferase subunit GatC [Eubacteriales bacterium]|nr:Asp-tRNA(Asn)/Glu-tRNA(Gln) amidotransferase subunit GatC [Eubacteriales bacterium]